MCTDHITPPQCNGGRGRQHIKLSPSLLSIVSCRIPHVLGEAGNLLIDFFEHRRRSRVMEIKLVT
jgi:hypothetical protein